MSEDVRVLVLPMPPALLPPYPLVDAVADLRAACDGVVAGLPRRVSVVAPPVDELSRSRGVSLPLGLRVARHLLGDRQLTEHLAEPGLASRLRAEAPEALVFLADGSAAGSKQAPGHLNPRAQAFDESVRHALSEGDAAALAGLDDRLAADVWCQGADVLGVLGELARGRVQEAQLLYDASPYGVSWWVARWTLISPQQPVANLQE